MSSDRAHDRQTDLTDPVGPLLSGSRGVDAAIDRVANALRQAHLQPVKVSLPCLPF